MKKIEIDIQFDTILLPSLILATGLTLVFTFAGISYQRRLARMYEEEIACSRLESNGIQKVDVQTYDKRTEILTNEAVRSLVDSQEYKDFIDKNHQKTEFISGSDNESLEADNLEDIILSIDKQLEIN